MDSDGSDYTCSDHALPLVLSLFFFRGHAYHTCWSFINTWFSFTSSLFAIAVCLCCPQQLWARDTPDWQADWYGNIHSFKFLKIWCGFKIETNYLMSSRNCGLVNNFTSVSGKWVGLWVSGSKCPTSRFQRWSSSPSNRGSFRYPFLSRCFRAYRPVSGAYLDSPCFSV